MGKFPRKVKGWKCLICDEFYEDFESARDCCPEEKDEETEQWQCIDCDKLYEDREDAYHCCE